MEKGTNEKFRIVIKNYFRPRSDKRGPKTKHLGVVQLDLAIGDRPEDVLISLTPEIREREDGTIQLAKYRAYGQGKFDWSINFKHPGLINKVIEMVKEWCEQKDVPFGEPLAKVQEADNSALDLFAFTTRVHTNGEEV